jgi:hypothetical protein
VCVITVLSKPHDHDSPLGHELHAMPPQAASASQAALDWCARKLSLLGSTKASERLPYSPYLPLGDAL